MKKHKCAFDKIEKTAVNPFSFHMHFPRNAISQETFQSLLYSTLGVLQNENYIAPKVFCLSFWSVESFFKYHINNICCSKANRDKIDLQP